VSNTDSGTFSVVIILTGTDASVLPGESGTIPLTITMSGTDLYTTVGGAGAGSGTMLRDRHHNVSQGG
jgi:hypothetical protein